MSVSALYIYEIDVKIPASSVVRPLDVLHVSVMPQRKIQDSLRISTATKQICVYQPSIL